MLYYFILTIFTSIAGAVSGIGGGVLIKPILDLTTSMNAASINFLSSSTVFSMAVVSLGKSFKEKQKVNIKESSILAAGSILGGLLGKNIFELLTASSPASNVKFIQSTILLFITLAVFMYFSFPFEKYTLSVKASPAVFSVGLLLGLISVFLGIGGGPLNLAVLSFFFSMPQKSAALNSIYIIFFSQLSSFTSCFVQDSFPCVPSSVLLFMVAGGFAGGYLGTVFRIRMTDRTSGLLFRLILSAILFINLYNAFHFLSLSTFI